MFKFVYAVAFIASGVLFSCSANEGSILTEPDLVQYVDPFIGTGFHGHTYPGPVMPHGMIQPGPDTRLNGWDASSGYHYSDSTIYGFSQTHLSGTGIGDMGDVLLLPFTGDTNEKPVATFSKTNEESEVGYYRVKFDNYDVEAELTSTMRVALHRYKFSGNEEKRLLLDLGHILQRTWDHSNVLNEMEIVDDRTIKGLKQSRGWATNHKVYFYIRFSSPFSVDEVIINDTATKEQQGLYKGKNVYSYLSFKQLVADEPLQIKVSISPVDVDGAKGNMEAEMPLWNFEQTNQIAKQAWNKELNRIHASSSNEDDLKIFYTALYHSLIAPMVYQDVDGRYRGMDLKIHQAELGTTNYTVYSLWDTFRALHPLMTIINEKKSVDWVNNLMLKYQQGDFLPKWPLSANYTGTMVAYPAVANIADAITKDLPGIDLDLALESSVNSALYKPELLKGVESQRKRELMPLYNKFVNEGSYIPADKIVKSVSYGLEMSYYDWCIARIADAKGDKEMEAYFDKRAKYYQLYFDEQTGFMRGKNTDGSWVTPFNPKHSSHNKSEYIEGNAWQWTWFVPHDIEGFANLFPSKKAFTVKLDSLFTTSSEIIGEDASGDITGLIGQYAHGNEPSHHIAYMYSYLGQGWKTQELIDEIQKEFYSSEPSGIIGNEDCGQMSAWYIMNAMGFYQVAPGDPTYVIARPLFDKVVIPLESGKSFTVIAENNSKDNKFVQQVFLNGKPLNSLFFKHSDIKNGSTLKIVMGKAPNKNLNSK